MTDPTYKILVVQDDPDTTRAIRDFVHGTPFEPVFANNFVEGRGRIGETPDFAIILSTAQLPDNSGIEFLIQARAVVPHAVRVLIADASDPAMSAACLDAVRAGHVFQFLPAPFSREDLLATLYSAAELQDTTAENTRLKAELAERKEQLHQTERDLRAALESEQACSLGLHRANDDMRRVFKDSIQLCLEFLQRIDMPLSKHAQRVARLSVAIGREMGCPEETLEKIEIAASFHDLGLLGVSRDAQAGQRNLDKIAAAADRELVENHAEISADFIKFLPDPDVIDAVANHHEYLDGSGYPRGLAREQISLVTAIVSLADFYDESEEPTDQIVPKIEMASGTLFQPDVVRAFSRLLSTCPAAGARERTVLVHELAPGMKLAGSVYTSTGMLLVKEGQMLTDTLIAKLKQHNDQGSLTQLIFIDGGA